MERRDRKAKEIRPTLLKDKWSMTFIQRPPRKQLLNNEFTDAFRNGDLTPWEMMGCFSKRRLERTY